MGDAGPAESGLPDKSDAVLSVAVVHPREGDEVCDEA